MTECKHTLSESDRVSVFLFHADTHTHFLSDYHFSSLSALPLLFLLFLAFSDTHFLPPSLFLWPDQLGGKNHLFISPAVRQGLLLCRCLATAAEASIGCS